MTSLLDIAPLTASVTVRGKEFKVTGLTAQGLIPLLQDFPEVRMMMSGKRPDFKPERFLQMMNEASASIIAAGLGHPGDSKIMAAAQTLAIGETADLMKAILGLTFPNGVSSFMEGLEALVGDAFEGIGWAQDMKSPVPLNGASQTDTHQK